jgi:hypothetical protein
MWCRSYRDHAIMAFPSFNAASGFWLCQANISWVVGASRESAFVRFPKRAASEVQAVSKALNAAEAWVDKRLRAQPIFASATDLRSSTLRAGPAHGREADHLPRLTRSPQPSTRTLTFDQFKLLMGQYGHQGSEQSLHKSYAALVLLRKQGHHSWAQIEFKIRHPREQTLDSPGWKSARLPLTAKDWRRII